MSKTGHAGSVPTIPSRYEVTLLKGDLEFKGFGCGSLRFGSTAGEDVPGPGNYGQRKAFHEENDAKACWGIRGTGGFASRSRRFGMRSMPQLPPAGLGCPGPGAYVTDGAIAHVKNPRDFSKAKYTAVFANPLGKDKDPWSAVPGPGYYGAPIRPPAKEAAAAQAAFKSTSMRGVAGASPEAAEMPGPGEYYEDHDAHRRAPPQSPTCKGSVFQAPSERKIVKVHTDLPAASREARAVLGKFGDEVARVPQGTVGLAAGLPGPGHYKQDRDAMWKGRTVGVGGMSSFQAGPQRTEWAPEEESLKPGPGRYEPHKPGPDTYTSAVSAFNSVSVRNKLQVPDAPGPAYYAPQKVPHHKSFRLNMRKQWGP